MRINISKRGTLKKTTAGDDMQRKRVGLALGAGGMRGMAHIGVMQVLEEAGIPIDLVSGASVGAFFGAAYAAEMDLYALGEYATWITRRDVLDVPRFFRTNGLLSGDKFRKLCRLVTNDRSFSETCVPFWCSAVDLDTGETRYLHEGPLSRAVRASISIPGLLRPVKIGGHAYIDGGTVEEIPIDILRENGADVVIAVDLSIGAMFTSDRDNVRRVLFRSLDIMRAAIARLTPKAADVLIRPDVSFMGQILPHDAARGIQVGRAAAFAALPAIRCALSL